MRFLFVILPAAHSLTSSCLSLPPGVFAGCYTVPHWMLPPLYKLCRVASHTLGVLTSQMSIVHEPTFRLDRTHAFIAFSMCTTGTKDPFDQQPLCIGDKNEICPPDPWKWVSAIIRQEVGSTHTSSLKFSWCLTGPPRNPTCLSRTLPVGVE